MEFQNLPSFSQLAPLRDDALFRVYLAAEDIARLCRLLWFYLGVILGLAVATTSVTTEADLYIPELTKVLLFILVVGALVAFAVSIVLVGWNHLRAARLRTQLRIGDFEDSPDRDDILDSAGKAVPMIRRQLVAIQYVGAFLLLSYVLTVGTLFASPIVNMAKELTPARTSDVPAEAEAGPAADPPESYRPPPAPAADAAAPAADAAAPAVDAEPSGSRLPLG